MSAFTSAKRSPASAIVGRQPRSVKGCTLSEAKYGLSCVGLHPTAQKDSS